MGFGKSETPQDRSYLLQDHVDNLERCVLDLDLRDITLVMHDFGGPAGQRLRSLRSSKGLRNPALMVDKKWDRYKVTNNKCMYCSCL